MDHPVKTAALLGMSVLGSLVEPTVNSSSGQECGLNKACTPGLPVMGDEPASESLEPPMAKVDIASIIPPRIVLTLAPGWTSVGEGRQTLGLPIRLPPGRFPSASPVSPPSPNQTV
jgi:hypothetical protein